MMNLTPNQSTSSQQKKGQKPTAPTGVQPSDSKEILFLAAGLITLTLGLGGVFIYSDDEPLPMTASQETTEEVRTFQMAEAFATPTDSSSPSAPSSPINAEPSLSLGSHASGTPDVQLKESTDVYFEFNRWALSHEAKDLMKTKIDALGEEWTGTLQIDGHTDAQGTDSYNHALGLRRAKSVKTYLVSLGIPEEKIQVRSFGKGGAVCQNQTPNCFEQNRRAHVAFLPQPEVQQDNPILSMKPEAQEDPSSDASPSSIDSPAIKVAENVPDDPEEISSELIAADPIVATESLP